MTKPLNPEKSRKLRPLRIILAALVVVLVILILDRLPTSVKTRQTTQNQAPNSSDLSAWQNSANTDTKFYYLNGFLELLETQLEAKLQSLGVPKEEYQNLSEYLSKDELFELETKVTLAASLEEVYVTVDASGLDELRQIFNLGHDYSFDGFQQLAAAPAEYKVLADLVNDYHHTLETVEDYDAAE